MSWLLVGSGSKWVWRSMCKGSLSHQGPVLFSSGGWEAPGAGRWASPSRWERTPPRCQGMEREWLGSSGVSSLWSIEHCSVSAAPVLCHWCLFWFGFPHGVQEIFQKVPASGSYSQSRKGLCTGPAFKGVGSPGIGIWLLEMRRA